MFTSLLFPLGENKNTVTRIRIGSFEANTQCRFYNEVTVLLKTHKNITKSDTGIRQIIENNLTIYCRDGTVAKMWSQYFVSYIPFCFWYSDMYKSC